MKLPSIDLLRSMFHYNPLTGGFVYLQQRGRRRAGEPAGSTIRGIPHLFVGGAQHRAAAVAWAMSHGADPSPQHVIPLDGNPLNLQLANLALSDQPFARSKPSGRRKAKRQAWIRTVKYISDEGLWKARYNGKTLGKYVSKTEALSAIRDAMKKKQSEQEENA